GYGVGECNVDVLVLVSCDVSSNQAEVSFPTRRASDLGLNVTIAQTAEVTFTADAADAGKSTVVANPTEVVADGVAKSTITVTVLDVKDKPVHCGEVKMSHGAGC